MLTFIKATKVLSLALSQEPVKQSRDLEIVRGSFQVPSYKCVDLPWEVYRELPPQATPE